MLLRRTMLLASIFLLQCATGGQASPEQWMDTTVCALRRNPQQWNHKLIRVTGYVTHGYEESSLVDPACGDYSDGSLIWMEYGGQVGSGTMYFGPVSPRHRETDLVVEGLSNPLVEDEKFQKLDKMLQSRPNSRSVVVVPVTLQGRFFSGKKSKKERGSAFGGFGHFGCCSLFVIEKVNSVAESPLNAQEEERFAEAFHLPPPPPPAPYRR